jgi:hypothetical protein
LGFLVAAVALLHAVRWSFTHPAVRVVVTAVGALAITYCTWIITFFSLLAYDTDEAVLATQDDVRLVVVNGINLIDPIQRVELQRDLGQVSQATVVWQGRPGGNTFGAGVPLIARSYAYFSGPQEVTVTAPRRDGRACLYRTHFDLLTLEPEQPHNDGDLTGPGC